jgi:hypothetical protein
MQNPGRFRLPRGHTEFDRVDAFTRVDHATGFAVQHDAPCSIGRCMATIDLERDARVGIDRGQLCSEIAPKHQRPAVDQKVDWENIRAVRGRDTETADLGCSQIRPTLRDRQLLDRRVKFRQLIHAVHPDRPARARERPNVTMLCVEAPGLFVRIGQKSDRFVGAIELNIGLLPAAVDPQNKFADRPADDRHRFIVVHDDPPTASVRFERDTGLRSTA